MAEAEVGDHLLGDDPTAARLEDHVAELLGKERALFFPSGTMANQTAINLHTLPGTEVLVMPAAHVLLYEEGGAAAWSGVQLREIGRDLRQIDAAAFEEAIQPPSDHATPISLVSLENTHNSGGGRILPMETLKRIARRAHDLGFPVHLDGARLPNAAVASGIPMHAWAAEVDTVMISLSKGLGAPVGSMLAGSGAAMEKASRIRRRFGGTMRQAGILAAAGLYALEHHFDRLADDHHRAKQLATGIDAHPLAAADAPESNIVIFEIAEEVGGVEDFVQRLDDAGVRTFPFGGRRVRAVTHLHVDDDGIRRAIEVVHEVLG